MISEGSIRSDVQGSRQINLPHVIYLQRLGTKALKSLSYSECRIQYVPSMGQQCKPGYSTSKSVTDRFTVCIIPEGRKYFQGFAVSLISFTPTVLQLHTYKYILNIDPFSPHHGGVELVRGTGSKFRVHSSLCWWSRWFPLPLPCLSLCWLGLPKVGVQNSDSENWVASVDSISTEDSDFGRAASNVAY